jgi:hypothetical protein
VTPRKNTEENMFDIEALGIELAARSALNCLKVLFFKLIKSCWSTAEDARFLLERVDNSGYGPVNSPGTPF